MSRMKDLAEALDRLAELFEFGTLRLSADPVGFIDDVIHEVIELRKENKELMDNDPYDDIDYYDDVPVEEWYRGEQVFIHLNHRDGVAVFSVEPYSCPGDWINSFSSFSEAIRFVLESGYKYDRNKGFCCTLTPEQKTAYERFSKEKIPFETGTHPLETE